MSSRHPFPPRLCSRIRSLLALVHVPQRAMWSDAPADLEAGNKKSPLLRGGDDAGAGTAAALASTSISADGVHPDGSGAGVAAAVSPSAEASPVNPQALVGVKFKTTYVFELDTSAKVFLFLVNTTPRTALHHSPPLLWVEPAPDPAMMSLLVVVVCWC